MGPITDFPRCAAYLKGMGIRISEPDMQDQHFAWLLGDAAFDEKELVEMGAATKPLGQWGDLLPAMEARFNHRTRKPKASKEARNQLLGMMCWAGLKGSAFKADSDIVKVAAILWPKAIEGDDMGLEDAVRRVRSLPKKARSHSVRENLHGVPPKYLSNGNEGKGKG